MGRSRTWKGVDYIISSRPRCCVFINLAKRMELNKITGDDEDEDDQDWGTFLSLDTAGGSL